MPEPRDCEGLGVLPLCIHNCYPGCSKGNKIQLLSGSPISGEPLKCPGWDIQWLHRVASTFSRPHLVRKRPTDLSWPQGVQFLEVPQGGAPQVMEVAPPIENSLGGYCLPLTQTRALEWGLKEGYVSPHSLCLHQSLREITPCWVTWDPSLMHSNLQWVKRQIGDTNPTFRSC